MSLLPGDIIELNISKETFKIDKVFENDIVDMTAIKKFKPEIGLNFHEQFFSIQLVDFNIIK